jgi:hypothetical protein
MQNEPKGTRKILSGKFATLVADDKYAALIAVTNNRRMKA